jgi:hypothetical protein
MNRSAAVDGSPVVNHAGGLNRSSVVTHAGGDSAAAPRLVMRELVDRATSVGDAVRRLLGLGGGGHE